MFNAVQRLILCALMTICFACGESSGDGEGGSGGQGGMGGKGGTPVDSGDMGDDATIEPDLSVKIMYVVPDASRDAEVWEI